MSAKKKSQRHAHHHHDDHAADDAPTLKLVGGPPTHEVRHHGRLITHLSEADARAYVDYKIETSGLDEQPEAKQDHDDAWDIRPRLPIELHYRGNLIDTFHHPEEAMIAKEEHAAEHADDDAPDAHADAAPHIAHRLIDAPKPIPVVDMDNPHKHPRTGEITYPQIIDPETGRPKMHTPKVVEAYEVPPAATDPYTIVDRSAAAQAATQMERGRSRG